MRHKLASITQSLRLPAICSLCNQPHQGTLALCSFCIDLLTPIGTRCTYCAYPLPEASHLICGHCIKQRPHFDHAHIAYTFEEPLRSLLHQFKYHNGLYLSPLLCNLMLKALPDAGLTTECLIPVPMHRTRLKQRGFNQAAVLAQKLAKQLQLPYNLHACKKNRNTEPQASLDQDERRNNLKQAFTADPLPYRHVTLIDDLLTTGSTANELALTLKESGVSTVDIWCCARTIHH